MCLSHVYRDEKTEENRVMEEAAVIQRKGGGFTVSSLFGENKELHGYQVRTIDFVKNFALLEKAEQEEHEHSHSHGHDTDSVEGKLHVLLDHLLDHNRDHIADIEKWADRAENAGLHNVSEELRNIAELYDQSSLHFEQAIDKLAHH